MAYLIEFGQDPASAFYAEFAIRNRDTGVAMPGGGVDHRFEVYGERSDYGRWGGFGQAVASTDNGRITFPEPGVIAVSVPPSAWGGSSDADTGAWPGGWDLCGRVLRYRLRAIPTDPDLAQTLVHGTIAFGASMPNPRIQLEAYPLYPIGVSDGTGGGSGGGVPAGSFVRSVWLRAAEATVPGSVVRLAAKIPADPKDPVAQAWADPYVASAGALATFWQTLNPGAPLSSVTAMAATLSPLS